MRLSRPALLLACAALAACQSAPSGPVVAPATISGSHLQVNLDRIDTFRVLEVDGQVVNLPPGDEPSRTLGVDATNKLDAGRAVTVRIEGLIRYRNTLRTLFWRPQSASGDVAFTPTPGAHYVVRGTIDESGTTVWVEDDATRSAVGQRVHTAPPAATPAAEWQGKTGGN